MEFQLITQKPALRNIHTQKLAISFFTKSEWEQNQITDIKTEAGYVKVSSAELTAFDMVQYHKRIGGFNRILPILEDLSENIKLSLLSKAARTEKQSNIQRLGFIFDKLDKQSLAEILKRSLNKKIKAVPLSLMHSNKAGKVNEKWKIIENIELDLQ